MRHQSILDFGRLVTLVVALIALWWLASVLFCAPPAMAAPLAKGDSAPSIGVMGSAVSDTIVTGSGYVRVRGGGGGVSSCDFAAWDAARVWLYAVDSSDKVTKRWGPFAIRSDAGARSLTVGSRFDLIQFISSDSLAITIGVQ